MLDKKLDELDQLLKRSRAYGHAISMIHWDMETEAPEKALERASEVLGVLSEAAFENFVNPKTKELLDYLNENFDKLDEIRQKSLVKLTKEYNKEVKIPKELISEYESLKAKAQAVWSKAKESGKFEDFAPYLEKLVDFNLKFIDLRGYEGHPYNTLLDDYEPGMTVEKLDEFFDYLREHLVPVIKVGLEKSKNINDDFLNESYDINKQKELSKFVAEYMNFDFSKGLLKESVHPFTLNFGKNDVRITTHYYENNITSAIFSTLHEGGHGLYEQNIADNITDTPLGEGSSMGIHESQSRIYENVFGRSYELWKGLYPKLQELFPRFNEVSLENFHKGINKASASFIRVEADELTYSLHVMIRYEIEKLIFNKEVDVKDLPKIWNEKIKEYLGLDVPNNSLGILQDVHWSCGLFGYFPSYALGNAYASQIEVQMRKDMDLDKALLDGDFNSINKYLTDKIHKYGSSLKPNELMEKLTGEDLNPKYFVDYLKNKYNFN